MKIEKNERMKFYKSEAGTVATWSSPFSKSARAAYWMDGKLYTVAIDRREFAENLRESRKNRKYVTQ